MSEITQVLTIKTAKKHSKGKTPDEMEAELAQFIKRITQHGYLQELGLR